MATREKLDMAPPERILSIPNNSLRENMSFKLATSTPGTGMWAAILKIISIAITNSKLFLKSLIWIIFLNFCHILYLFYNFTTFPPAFSIACSAVFEKAWASIVNFLVIFPRAKILIFNGFFIINP